MLWQRALQAVLAGHRSGPGAVFVQSESVDELEDMLHELHDAVED